jgi:hypothetical protein
MSDGQLAVLVVLMVSGFLTVAAAISRSSYTQTEVLAAKLDDIVNKLGDIAAKRLP